MKDSRTRLIHLLIGILLTALIAVWSLANPKSSSQTLKGVSVSSPLHLFGKNAADDSGAKPQPVEIQNVKVMAHYMPWFRRAVADSGETQWSHWQWQGKGDQHDPNRILENGQHDIASVFYPLIGPYHSQDPAVIEYHILTAKLAGVEAFMCNWYGPGTYTDQSVALMLPIAEKYDFKIGICFEEKAFFPPYSKAENREQLVDEMERHLRHILNSYSGSPALLRQNGIPLLFMFNFFGEGPLGSNLLSSEEIAEARGRIEDDFLLVRNELAATQFPSSDGAFVWCGGKSHRDTVYKKLTEIDSAHSLAYQSSVVSPGFDDTGVHGWGNEIRQTSRRGVDEYLENWQEAIDKNLNSVQIVTWNDFEEGTTIEPTVEYEFKFVDLAEEHIGKLTGRAVDISDNRLGLELYRLRVAMRSVPEESVRVNLDHEIDALGSSVFNSDPGVTVKRIEDLKQRIDDATVTNQ